MTSSQEATPHWRPPRKLQDLFRIQRKARV